MKIAMLFPGFGSQFVGMGKELYDEHRIIQEFFEQAASCIDINFVKLCFASSEAELRQMRNAYTAIFLVSSAIATLLKEKGIKPDVVAGFNQGEYAALLAAGGWTLPDGLYLLNKFAGFYQELLDTLDAAALGIIGLDTDTMNKVCASINRGAPDKVYVALTQTDTHHIVAGNASAVQRLVDKIHTKYKEQKISIEKEDVAVGLHSPLMNPVVDRYKMYLEKTDFRDLQPCMIESLIGECIQEGAITKKRAIKHINSPVIWPKVMNQLANYDILIQIGPGTQLATWAMQMYPDKKVLAINKPADIIALEQLLKQG